MNYNFKDITGQKFNRLTAIKTVGTNKWGNYIWLCKCECSNLTKVVGSYLINGNIKSCGCLKKELAIKRNKTHGMTNSGAYKSWTNMKRRIRDPQKNKYYYNRGIKVCKKWEDSFLLFYKDMGERPNGKSLDRINNNKGYCKENCRWATWKQQARNKRDNIVITYKGETMCLVEWIEKLKLNTKYRTLKWRFHRNWSADKIFNTKK